MIFHDNDLPTDRVLTLQECMVSQTVGTPSAEVLYTFTDRQAVDTLALSSLVTVRLQAYGSLADDVVTCSRLEAV